MRVKLESYNPQKYDTGKLARLIYESDEQINSLTYGENPIEVVEKLLGIAKSYFVPEYMKCILVDDGLAGVVVYFPVSKYDEVDKTAGQGFIEVMGFIPFLKKMPLYMKMSKMLGGEMDEDGLYIHTISVDGNFRNRGVGSKIIEMLESENEKMYLYVNVDNEKALRFYEKNGFVIKHMGSMKYKGGKYGEYLMEKK